MTHRIVVLGAGYAGLNAAKGCARKLRGREVSITLVNAVDHFVERVRLHQLAAGQEVTERPLADAVAGTGVDLVVATATGIDLDRQEVAVDAAPHRIGYDTLVYALGSRGNADTVPGAAEHCLGVASEPEAQALAVRVAEVAAEGGSVAVVGGGLTGIEMATELAETYPGLRVTLVEAGELGAALSPRGRRKLATTFARLGVELVEHAPVAEVAEGKLLTTSGDAVVADLLIWTGGFAVPALAADAGLAVDGNGRMLVDPTLRSVSHPEVYGVGDAAAARTTAGLETRMSCQTARPMGLAVAGLIKARLDGREPNPATIRYQAMCISLGRRDAVLQPARPDYAPRSWVLGSRTAPAIKESICRFVALPAPGR